MSGPGAASWLARGPAQAPLSACSGSARTSRPRPYPRIRILADPAEGRRAHLPFDACPVAALSTSRRRAAAADDRRQVWQLIEEVMR